MTLDDLILQARSLAEHGCSYAEACELLARDLGRPLTTDERQEVWAATDGDGDTPAQAVKAVTTPVKEHTHHSISIQSSLDKGHLS